MIPPRIIRLFPLTSFFVGAYIWTWVCWWSAAALVPDSPSAWGPRNLLATLGQYGPVVSALGVAWTTGGRQGLHELLRRLTSWRVRPVWLLVSLLLLPAMMIGAILLYERVHGMTSAFRFRDGWNTLPIHFVYTLLLGGPLGEEPGWRGFALPRLQARKGPVLASIWLGVLWAVWHLPLWFIYPAPCPFPLYVVGAIFMTILFTWLFNHTRGSVFYCLLFHTSMNTASTRLPEVAAYHYWVACLVVVAMGILVWDRQYSTPVSELRVTTLNSN